MSVAEFSAALKEQAYKSWFKNSAKNILRDSVKGYRKEAQAADRTSLLLTTDMLLQVAARLQGFVDSSGNVQINRIPEDQQATLIQNLLDMVDPKGRALYVEEDVLETNSSGQQNIRKVKGIFFRQIDFDKGINSVMEKALKSVKITETYIDETTKQRRTARFSDFFQKGHVFAVATNITKQTERNLEKSQLADKSKQELLRVLRKVREKLVADDLASANIKNPEFSLYAKYSKTPYKYLVEIQVREGNRESGATSKLYTNALRRYYDPSTNAGALQKDLNTRSQNSEGDSLFRKLMESPGSPSYIDLIAKELAAALSGKKTRLEYKAQLVKFAETTRTIDTSEIRAKNKQGIAKIDKAIQELNSRKSSVPASNSLASLEALLRANLQAKIKDNMGDGNARNVLNYRSGRFASSANIERLSMSRAGMVSVFYSYMRNPYATFSEGGRQQYPRSRDPKTLISKSIRQIGAELAYTNMRAILV